MSATIAPVRRDVRGVMTFIPGVIVLAGILAGCSTPPWRTVGGRYDAKKFGCEVELPAGWCQDTAYGVNPESEDFAKDATILGVTRDGIHLQTIAVRRYLVGLSLNPSAKRMREDMSPSDAMAVELKELEALGPKYTLLEHRLLSVGSHPGYQLVYTFKGDRIPTYTHVHCATVVGRWLYLAEYTAATRHYFERDRATFDRVLESFRIL